MCANIDHSRVLIEAIKSKDSDEVHNILDKNLLLTLPGCFFHLVCNFKEGDDCRCSEEEKDIIYFLIDYGFDLEEKDEYGNTCLFYAVQENHAVLCEVFLQCGADMWANTQFNISILDYVLQTSSIKIRNIFDKFYPGVWKAIEWEDIYKVRQLVNLWCRTDLNKDGMTIKDIALKTGHEEIISLILGVFDTMKLIYHILAKNIKALRQSLESNHHKVRLNLRKMSDRGAPILYYLIKSAYIEAIELFIKYGCHLYTIMQDDSGFDMPVLFSAFKSSTPLSVIEALLPPEKLHQEEMLFKILYRGKTVLEIALAEKVTPEAFGILIDRGGSLLLCERNQINQTVREQAVLSGEIHYINVIDLNVVSWIYDPHKYPERRKKLALLGWNFKAIQEQLHEKTEVNDYLNYVKNIQNGIKSLSSVVEDGDVRQYYQFKSLLSNFEKPEKFLWQVKTVDDGMPLLHRAVLYNRLEIVTDILSEKPQNESIDNLFDQNRRTALHYAYASNAMKEIRNLLMTYGCSEHVLDKINKEPLDFRDKQDTIPMEKLLERIKLKNFEEPESDPWSSENSNLLHNSSSLEKDTFLEEINQSSDSENGTESQYSEEDTGSFCLVS